MLEALLIIGVLFIILTFFYKQASSEFRMNQLEWTQREHMRPVLHEKVPLIVRNIPPIPFWTTEDVLTRPCYELPLFNEMSLVEWRKTSTGAPCPWKYTHAEQIATVAGLHVWAEKWMNPSVLSPYLKGWWHPRYHCWAGNKGLHRTYATWTCILPIEGELLVSILPEKVEASLPQPWAGCFPSELTAKDTPFVGDISFMDIVLRPGHALFMPAHWFVCWVGNKSVATPMVATISYHSPISLLAFHASPLNS